MSAAFFLHSAHGSARESETADEFRQEWTDIQANVDRQVRENWWRNIAPERLNAFIAAGVEVRISDERGWTPLHSAARYNSHRIVVLTLLQAGSAADAQDSSGDTALHWAAAENPNVEILHVLLEAGADVNASDKWGWLPIHAAADKASNPEIIAALLAAGAELDKRAYYVLFSPAFLLKNNSNMSEPDKKIAMDLFKELQ